MESLKWNWTIYSRQLSPHWFMTNWLHIFQQYSTRPPSASLAPETNSFSQLWSREKFFTVLPLPWLNLPLEKKPLSGIAIWKRRTKWKVPISHRWLHYWTWQGLTIASLAFTNSYLCPSRLLSLSSSRKRWVIKPVSLAMNRLTHINKSAQWKPINVWGNQRPFR